MVTTESQSSAVVKFNIFFKVLPFGSKGYSKELKTVKCTSVLGQTS